MEPKWHTSFHRQIPPQPFQVIAPLAALVAPGCVSLGAVPILR